MDDEAVSQLIQTGCREFSLNSVETHTALIEEKTSATLSPFSRPVPPLTTTLSPFSRPVPPLTTTLPPFRRPVPHLTTTLPPFTLHSSDGAAAACAKRPKIDD